MISLCLFTKSPVKVFRRVISKAKDTRLLVILFDVVLGQLREYGILREVGFQRNYKKRKLAVLFFFWPVFILPNHVTETTILVTSR